MMMVVYIHMFSYHLVPGNECGPGPQVAWFLWTAINTGTVKGHLLVITGYKWDYTFYKWGYKYL